jgi:hypothetical protein
MAYADPASDPAELCTGGSAEVLEGQLLDSYLPNTYAHGPTSPARNVPAAPYSVAQARRWLGFLAQHLDRVHSRDLAWWRLHQAVSPDTRAAYLGLATAVFLVATGWLDNGPVLDAIYGLSFGLAGYATHRFGHAPEPFRTELRLAGAAGKFTRRFGIGAVVGVLLGLDWSLAPVLVVLLSVVFGLVVAVHVWLAKPVDANRVSSPATILRNERTGALTPGSCPRSAVTSTWHLAVAGGLADASAGVGNPAATDRPGDRGRLYGNDRSRDISA